MVTFAQAQERAERWVNGSPDVQPRREVRVREFDLGFVAWAEEPGGATEAPGGKLVIARDSGDTTLWPALPVADVIRRYEETYGSTTAAPAGDRSDASGRVDLEATSFLLTPPQWLQEAADRAAEPAPEPAGTAGPAGSAPADAEVGAEAGAEAAGPAAAGDPGQAGAAAAADPQGGSQPGASSSASAAVAAHDAAAAPAPAASDTGGDAGGGTRPASPWDAADTSGSKAEAASVAPPMTVFSPPVVPDPDSADTPSVPPEAKTTVMPQGSALPKTAIHPELRLDQPPPSDQPPQPSPPPGPPGATPPPPSAAPGGTSGDGTSGAADLASADTARASVPPQQGGSSGAGLPIPPPPVAPGAPGAGRSSATPPPAPPSPSDTGGGSSASAYVPTQLVSADDIASQGQRASQGPPSPPTPPPQPSQPSRAGGSSAGGPDSVHNAATVLAPGSAIPPPPAAPGGTSGGGTSGGGTGGYGYPPGQQPTVGSGYMAVLRYRAADGSEQQIIRRSAPGMPHPEWQILYELRSLNVPPQAVLELHTELQSCEVPGGYCARMVRETWPQVRITHTAAYGRDLASRQAGVRHLVEHQDELEQFADGPPRAAPVRVPLPQVQPAPAIGLDAIGHELVEAYGPQGVFRYEPQFASRQGVPDIVTHTLTWAGLPFELNPFFWAFAQPGRPVPTLAEVALERGVQPAPDAGSYLVMGTDFGKQLCVQFGTAYVVAVPLEAAPGGQAVPPQFVNASLPQFVRCMALLGRMWRLRYGLTPQQAGHWTTDFQAQLAALDPQAVADPESWWSVLLEQMWDGLL